MIKKRKIILLEELATPENFQEYIKKGVYPLGIDLNEQQTEEYKKWERDEGKEISPTEQMIKDLYSPALNPTNNDLYYLYLDAYALRRKIAEGSVYVNKFIDKNYQEKNVDYISEAYGLDLDSPRIVFRKYPRILFRTFDNYDEKKDDYTKGKDLLQLSFEIGLFRKN